MEDFYL